MDGDSDLFATPHAKTVKPGLVPVEMAVRAAVEIAAAQVVGIPHLPRGIFAGPAEPQVYEGRITENAIGGSRLCRQG